MAKTEEEGWKEEVRNQRAEGLRGARRPTCGPFHTFVHTHAVYMQYTCHTQTHTYTKHAHGMHMSTYTHTCKYTPAHAHNTHKCMHCTHVHTRTYTHKRCTRHKPIAHMCTQIHMYEHTCAHITLTSSHPQLAWSHPPIFSHT